MSPSRATAVPRSSPPTPRGRLHAASSCALRRRAARAPQPPGPDRRPPRVRRLRRARRRRRDDVRRARPRALRRTGGGRLRRHRDERGRVHDPPGRRRQRHREQPRLGRRDQVVRALLRAPRLHAPEPVFQPGAYSLKAEMSAKSALAALLDSDSTRLANTFVIPEGTALAGALPLIADGTGVPLEELQAAAADFGSYGLPAEATSLEGFLFPATYDVDPSTPAHDILQTLVTRMFQALDEAQVAPEDRYRVVVFASLVQREARIAEDFPKVARVFQNRLDQGWRLQSDATVAYGTGATDRVSTTDAERGDVNNVYNTYQRDGLPPAPISNPGDVAIEAVLRPAEGTWMYFVTVNLETGETVYSTTDAEHNAAVDQWQSWMRANPEYQ
ncbi:hypothetical protein B0T42_02930 [Rathayibacter sp. VKM Ac-2630]|nr:hypothetical protein B0T42_02930 [Rathayibacter sp. VKM Ac-2630]